MARISKEELKRRKAQLGTDARKELAKIKKPSAISDPILKEVIKRLVDAYHPDKIYLFGSRARQTASSASDYDLLMVVPENVDRKLKTSGRAYEALWGIKAPIDVVVWTDKEFNRRLHLSNSLPSVVIREGTLLHAS